MKVLDRPRAEVHALLRLVQKRWPPEPPAASPREALCRSVCNEYGEWLHVDRGLAKASIRALMWEGWRAARCAGAARNLLVAGAVEDIICRVLCVGRSMNEKFAVIAEFLQ